MRHSGGPRNLIPGRAVTFDAYERMDEAEKRDARAGSRIRYRRPATTGVPAKDSVREAEALHGVDAGGQLHAAGRHLHDVRAAGCVEQICAIEEAREALAVLAIADEAK
jgi:hypothetical protein